MHLSRGGGLSAAASWERSVSDLLRKSPTGGGCWYPSCAFSQRNCFEDPSGEYQLIAGSRLPVAAGRVSARALTLVLGRAALLLYHRGYADRTPPEACTAIRRLQRNQNLLRHLRDGDA